MNEKLRQDFMSELVRIVKSHSPRDICIEYENCQIIIDSFQWWQGLCGDDWYIKMCDTKEFIEFDITDYYGKDEEFIYFIGKSLKMVKYKEKWISLAEMREQKLNIILNDNEALNI